MAAAERRRRCRAADGRRAHFVRDNGCLVSSYNGSRRAPASISRGARIAAAAAQAGGEKHRNKHRSVAANMLQRCIAPGNGGAALRIIAQPGAHRAYASLAHNNRAAKWRQMLTKVIAARQAASNRASCAPASRRRAALARSSRLRHVLRICCVYQ